MRSFLSACLLAVACWPVSPALARELRLAVSAGPVSLPIYVAEAQGFFQQEGAEVKLLGCSSGRDCVDQLVQGKADVATAAELLVTLNNLTKGDLTIVATMSGSHQIRLVARRSAGMLRPKDILGKRVGIVVGTSAEYYLDAWLLYQGLDRSEVQLVALPAERLGPAMLAREVDAVVIWEPIASHMADALEDDLSVMPTPRVYTQHFALVTDRHKTAEVEAEIVRLLRALARAGQLIKDDPATARQILKARLRITDAQASACLLANDYTLGLDQSLLSTMESQARWAARSGLVSKGAAPVNLLRAIDPGLLRAAVPGAVSLVR